MPGARSGNPCRYRFLGVAIVDWFDRRRDYAACFIRFAIGTRLISGTQDNVFSAARMDEFAGFLAANGTPFPHVGAFVSVYAQFIGGALFILGLWTRPAAVVM